VLGREVDKTGFLDYITALSQGCGKDYILINLMNSEEAQRLTDKNKPHDGSANSDVLSRELDQLCEVHSKNRRAHRIFRGRRSCVQRKELNALEFRLESMFLSMLGQVKSEIFEEITRRLDLHHEVGKPAHNNSRTVNVIQAQRRSVSRPGREG